MKFKITLIAFVAALALPAAAQSYNIKLPTGYTSTQRVLGMGTTNLNWTFAVPKQTSVAVAISFKLDDTGTNGVQTLTFERSVDNSNWETLAAKKTVIGIASTGETVSTTVTNIPLYGAGFLRLSTWLNGDGTGGHGVIAATNIVVKFAEKTGL